MKNVNIMGVHQFLKEGDHKKNNIYIWGIAQKGGLGQFADLAKNRDLISISRFEFKC